MRWMWKMRSHLSFCLSGKRIALSATKGLLVPLIMAAYVLLCPAPSPLVLLAQLFGWIGDLLLLSKRKRNFILGACSFLLGHGFYIAAILLTLHGPPPGLVVLALLFPLFPLLSVLLFHKELGEQRVLKAMPVYFALLGGLVLTAAAALLRSPGPGSVCLFFGAVLFLISDTILVTLMLKRTRAASYGSFWVMLTYIFAQALLAAGFIQIP